MKMIGNKNRKGYLMMEAVLAVFIVGTTFTVFMTVLSKTQSSEFKNRDYVIASGLAQEGIEIVRNIRDNNWKEGEDGFDSSGSNGFRFAPPSSNDACYQFAYNYNSITLAMKRPNDSCPSSTLNRMNIDSNGLYGGGGGTQTKFKRGIKIKGDGDTREIESIVYWTPSGSSTETSVKVSDTLYDWADKQE